MAESDAGLESVASKDEIREGNASESLKTDGADVKCASESVPKKQQQQGGISKQKIDLLLKATGDAPIMKQKKWTVESDRQIGSIITFIKKYLKLEASDSLVRPIVRRATKV